MNLKQRVFEILNRTHLMSLGTCDENGIWVSGVIFVFENIGTVKNIGTKI